ncbi:OmpA family protein [Algoriphagus resistens]|uniref:OmpA family protein n=1 Tax=Algoriphagus resistens TaxID=1750590 RepID=UPI000716A1B2|nr:OmpA family protein [Algoriphagus resistens]
MKYLLNVFVSVIIFTGLFTEGLSPVVQAQSILNKVKNRGSQAATQSVLKETDKVVSRGIDKAFKFATNGIGEGQEEVIDETDSTTKADKVTDQRNMLASFSKYDFQPGDAVLYANDFGLEAIGELPTGWNSNGSSVIVSLNGIPGNWLRMAQRAVVLTDNESSLGPDFTVEFDMVLQFDFKGYLAPSLKFGLLDSGSESPSSNKLLSDPKGDKSFYVEISPHADGGNLMLESYEKYTRYFNSPSTRNSLVSKWYGKVVHVAMQGQKERLRIWVDGEKLYDVPKGLPKIGVYNQLFFQLGSSSYTNEQVGVYFSNIKIAKGLPDTRHKLVEEGRFSTTGILFDTGSAIIKPESAGVLKSISDVLALHPEIRVSITGHTDITGEESANLVLSGRRAAAVKEALHNIYKVDASRMETEGKGESEPVGDNHTPMGRAQNRRVEFIKL